MVVPAKHMGGMWGAPRKRHMKANFMPKERAYKEMGRPRGGLGGPKRRSNKWDALKVLGGTLMDLDGTMGYGHMNQAAQGIQQRNAMMAEQAERERRQAMLTKYTDGLTPEQAQLAQLAPEKFLDAKVEQAFAQPAGPEYQFMNIDGVGYRGDKREGTLTALTDRYIEPEAPVETWSPIPPPENMGGYWERNDVTGQTRRVAAPPSNGISIDKDGNIQIGGAQGGATTRYMAGQDAAQLADARERANALQPVLNTMYAARAELLGPDGVEGTDDDLDTGSFAPIVQTGRRFLFGEQPDERRYDNFEALSKEFGIEKLAGIGGNDTERELLTAIQTGPNMGAQEGSNLSRINRQIAVFEFIGESRRNFMARWQADHGSLSRVAETGPYKGKTFDEAMSVFQREEALRQGLLGAAPSGQSSPDSTVGVTRQEGDLTPDQWTNEQETRLAYLEAKSAGRFTGTYEQWQAQGGPN